MTKRHFIALADAIREHNLNARAEGVMEFHESQIDVLADFCQSQNSHFMRDRWLGYIAGECGSNGGRKGKVGA